MTKVHVVEKIWAIPNKREELKQALLNLIPMAKQEEGCLAYDLYESSTETNLFVILMLWESKAHLDAHHTAPFIKTFEKEYDQLLYSKATEDYLSAL